MELKNVKYNIVSDMDFVIEAENKTKDEFAKEIGISRNTYYEIKKNGYTIDSVYEKIYSYLYKSKYRINSVKEEILKEVKKNKVLFHGSKFGISNISIEGSRNNCDFGNGFYLGESYSQALAFVCDNDKSSVYSFELNLDGLNVLELDCSLEWMLSICYFRGTLGEYKNNDKVKNIISKFDNVDVVIAPIADNRMFYIMSLFANGDINANVALHSLSASKLGMQYVLKTDKAINSLVFIEKYYLCSDEKNDCKKNLIERSNEIETKLKLARREFRDGLFIEEILN